MERLSSSSSSSSRSSSGSPVQPFIPRRSRAFYKFTQQNLPACKPSLTPGLVITAFLLIGIASIPVGIICLHASDTVAEIVDRYDVECIPEVYRGNKVAYIKDGSISKNCTRTIKVHNYMKAPIYVYYELDNFYQNHRRYVKSKSDKQLLYGLEHKRIGSCQPEVHSNGLPIVPCGLIAWSLFNDTYTFVRGTTEMNVNRKNISWQSDRDHKYGKHIYPFNFQNGTLIGGGTLDPDIPLSEQEDLIVWMRVAALPKFRKLYGVIEEDLEAEELLTVHLANNYNTYSFGGKKKLVLTTSNWLGGKNNFLGLAYIASGCLSIFTAILFALLHVKNPRPNTDVAYTLHRKFSAR